MNVEALQKKGIRPLFAKDYLPHLSVDCVVFGFSDEQLQILLTRIDALKKWMLPGGYIKRGEDLEQAARRILAERTGLDDIFLRQFQTFGSASRTFGEEIDPLLDHFGRTSAEQQWIKDRFVTVGYYALIKMEALPEEPPVPEGTSTWADIKALPEMMMDHAQIAQAGLEALRRDMGIFPVGYNLLPEKFTMPELQAVYETVLDRKIERSAFQKKMLKMNIYERLPERREGVPHKRPYLYRFHPERYAEALKEGLKFGI